MRVNPSKSQRWLLSVGVAVAMAAPTTVLAQPQTDETDEAVEEIIVTGSRIRQNPLDARAPVQVLSDQDIDRSGQVSLADYLQRLPISGSAINKTNNSSGNLGFPPDGAGIGAGAAEIDLRYLQSKRVLVLVDGRRWVRGSSASGVSGAVDLNTIPVNAIKSIEVLQDGASAVYGSDAIGGVINIITQDDYDTLRVSAYYGEFDKGDGTSEEYDIAWGAHTERARIFMDLNYTKQGGVSAGDREISEFPIPGFPFGASSGTPSGRFLFVDPRTGNTVNVTANPGVGPNPVFDPANPGSADFHNFTLADRFNYQPFNFISTPNERVSVFTKGEFDLTDNVTLRALVSFNNRQSTSMAAPEPLFFGPAGGSGVFMENLFFPADHPFNPFGVDLGPDDIIFLTKRPIEAGPRVFNQDVDTWYLSTGLEGTFDAGGRPVYWDVNFIWAENDARQKKNGAFNARNLVLGMGPQDQCAAVPGCVPVNIIGEGSLTQEMLDFVTFIQKDDSQQEMLDIQLNLSGEVGNLPAGPIGWAVGYEYREEDGAFTPDSVVTRGETAGVPASPTAGGFDVSEIYAEVVVPLLADRPGAERLDLSAAVRYSDYDLFASDEVFKLGLNWRVTEDFLVRGSFSEGYRAPNIGELFNTGSRFDAGINDPCSNAPASLASNCAALGVPPGFMQPNPQIPVTTGGNVNLVPETSDTWTVGFVYDPNWAHEMNGIERLTFEFNYYDIDTEDAIQPPDAQDILDQCAQTLDPFFCNNIMRSPDGTVTRVDGILQNIGGIESDGFDFSVRLETEDTSWGRWVFQWVNTVLGDYTEIIPGPTGFVEISREGTELGSPERSFHEWKSSLITDWYKGNWNVGVTFRYLDELTERCGGLVEAFELQADFCSDPPNFNTIGDKLYTDAVVGWNPDFYDKAFTFKLGAQNLFDTKTPLCYSCDLNSFDGTIYPIDGTFWYAAVDFRM